MPGKSNSAAAFDNELSAYVWQTKYAYGSERTIADTWDRIAAAVASVESARMRWTSRFREALSGFRFLPAGRILASADTPLDATLCNCFVMGVIEDSIEGIFRGLTESAITMQRGGGIGCDFSTLRPAGAPASATRGVASGPASFLRLWDAMCATLLGVGNRRGAMMGSAPASRNRR